MIHCHHRKFGISFQPDCPDHIKKRSMSGVWDALISGKPPRLAHCDREWVTLIDGSIPGWWVPLVGFVSDDDLRALARRLLR